MTTTTQTLAEFLLARIAEDEATAREVLAQQQYDVTRSPGDFPSGYDPAQDFDLAGADGPIGYTVVMIGVARVLAECEAKRRIVEALLDAEQAVAAYDNDDPNNPSSYWQEWGNRHALRLATELLALPYSDHPDHRDEWRP